MAVVATGTPTGPIAPAPVAAPGGKKARQAKKGPVKSPNSVGPETLGTVREDEAKLAKVDDRIKSSYDDILDGKKGSFSDERFALQKQSIFEENRAQARASNQHAIAQAALTGTARGGFLQSRFADIDRSMRSDTSKAVTQLMVEREKAQFEDYKFALQGMGQWLAQKRTYMIGKQQIAATIQSARIQASATMGAAALAAGATKFAASKMAGASHAATKAAAKASADQLDFDKMQYDNAQENQTVDTILDTFA